MQRRQPAFALYSKLLITGIAVLATACVGKVGDEDEDDAPDPVPGPPEIQTQSPVPDDANAWVFAPIEIEFNEPIDADTVQDGITVTVDNLTVDFTVGLSAPNRILVLLDATPPLPATVAVEIADTVMDSQGEAFAGAQWSFSYPVWQSPADQAGGVGNGAAPSLATGPSGTLVLAHIDGGQVQVSMFGGSTWSQLGAPLGTSAASDVHVALDASGNPTVTWSEAGDIYAATWEDSGWQVLGGGPVEADPVIIARAPQVVIDGQTVFASWIEDDATLAVSAWSGAAWTPLAPHAAGGTVEGSMALDMQSGAPTVAYAVNGNIEIAQWDGSAWTALPSPSVGAISARSPSIIEHRGQLTVAFVSDDILVRVSQFDSGAWSPLGATLASGSGTALQPRIAATSSGELFASWSQGSAFTANYQTRISRWTEAGGWQAVGPTLGDPSAEVVLPDLAIDSFDQPVLAWSQDPQDLEAVHVRRYNDSPNLPFGLYARASIVGCSIPDDAAPNFPATLTATGCYLDVAAGTLHAGFAPYDLNSPLWTDGASKRRFIAPPDGETITYTDSGAFVVPTGTLLIKEFHIESITGDPASSRPVETRILVKRCEEGDCPEPWQGYSYQWNEDASEADLLLGDATVIASFPVIENGAPITRDHEYPSRAQCTRCHNENAGRMLGVQAAQLNRDFAYGDVVDNQLRAMSNAGFFAEGSVPEEVAAALPNPKDSGHTYEDRSRAYFHSNCSQCHQPGGERPTIDFRYQTPLAVDNICNRLTPGDGVNSLIYVRDATRGPGQMPPLGTLVADDGQLINTAAWIDNMVACP